MARSRTPKFDASEVITNEIIRIIERGVLPWRKPWTAGGSSRPLRVGGEPYQGVNNFLLTMRTVMAGHSSPFWMTLPQANALDAKVRKSEKSAVVVYYGQSRKDAGGEDDHGDNDDRSEEARIFRFQKSYRVFNACQIEGLPDSFFPDPEPMPEHPPSDPIPHTQAFFDAIDITTVFTGTEAYYLPPVDKVYMPSITRFHDPRNFYGVWAHELAHATKAPHRLNRDFGFSKFGNTSYARGDRRGIDLGVFGAGAWLHGPYARDECCLPAQLVARSSVGQRCDLPPRRGCAACLRLPDRHIGDGQGREQRRGRLTTGRTEMPMSRKEPKTLRVACFNDGRRKIITFKRGAYWWSPSEGAYPLSAALESIKEQGGWIETIPNPNYRPKGLFG